MARTALITVAILVVTPTFASPEVLPIQGLHYGSYHMPTSTFVPSPEPVHFGETIWAAAGMPRYYFADASDRGWVCLDWGDTDRRRRVASFAIAYGTMEMHPAVAFGAALAGASLLGFVGAILALPAAAMVQAISSARGPRHEVVDSHLTTVQPRGRAARKEAAEAARSGHGDQAEEPTDATATTEPTDSADVSGSTDPTGASRTSDAGDDRNGPIG